MKIMSLIKRAPIWGGYISVPSFPAKCTNNALGIYIVDRKKTRCQKNNQSCREGSRRHDHGPSTASDHGRRPLIQRFDDPATWLSEGSGAARMNDYCTVVIAWQKTLKIPKKLTDQLRSAVGIGSSLPCKKQLYRVDIFFYVRHGRCLSVRSGSWWWWWTWRGRRSGFMFGYSCESVVWFSIQSWVGWVTILRFWWGFRACGARTKERLELTAWLKGWKMGNLGLGEKIRR